MLNRPHGETVRGSERGSLLLLLLGKRRKEGRRQATLTSPYLNSASLFPTVATLGGRVVDCKRDGGQLAQTLK